MDDWLFWISIIIAFGLAANGKAKVKRDLTEIKRSLSTMHKKIDEIQKRV